MKNLLLLAILFALNANAQKIKVSEKDKFLKKYRIETSMVTVKSNFSGTLGLKLRSVNETVFANFQGQSYIDHVVSATDEIIFLLKNDSTLKIRSKEIQSPSIMSGSLGSRYIFNIEYIIGLEDIEQLSKNAITSIRIYTAGGYKDVDVKESAASDVMELCNIFLKEYKSKKDSF